MDVKDHNAIKVCSSTEELSSNGCLNVPPLTSAACDPVVFEIVESSILLINLSPIKMQRILMKRIAHNLCKHGS